MTLYILNTGKGTSNDGKTARRFFKNCDKSANITGVDKNLIQRFGNILFAMSSGHEVNVPEFKMYTADTAKLFISLYPWYPCLVVYIKFLYTELM